MNIIIEGPDNSGKSTLVSFLAERFPVYNAQTSGGPEQEPGELKSRVEGYLQKTHILFDRHPCVSDPLYSKFRSHDCTIPQHYIDSFYRQNNFYLYCRGRDLGDHVIKPHETEEHVAMVNQHHGLICELYDDWALKNATLIYRIGDNMDGLYEMIKASIMHDHRSYLNGDTSAV